MNEEVVKNKSADKDNINYKRNLTRGVKFISKPFLSSQNSDFKLGYRITKCYFTLLYGTEGWTLKVSSMHRESFGIWIFQRILKIA